MTAQELKNAILQLAVQGKLTRQLPEDGTAEVLYQQIQKEKKQIAVEKKIKWKKQTELNNNELPFNTPDTWKWLRLGDILYIESGKGLTSKQMLPGNIPVYGGNGITGYHNTSFIHNETVVIGRVGYYCGSVHITEKEAWITDNAFITTYPEKCIDKKYLVFVLQQMQLGLNNNGSAQPVVSGKKIYPLPFPLPPLAEQKRIVEKIEELLPLVERYGAAEEELQRLNAEFPEQLRKSILQQAVQGKLVSQYPADGTAEELLKKIRKEKDKLVREGKIKKEKPLPPITEDEIPFEIPESWAWVRLGEICEYGKCENIEPIDLPENVWILELEDIEKQTGKILKRHYSGSYLTKSTKHLFKKGNVLFSKLRPNLNKVVVADDNGCCTSEILPLDFGELYPYYMQLFLMSPGVVEYLTSKAFGQKMPRVGTSTGINLLVPLPPLAEQKRIVEKIESLLPRCDELKQR